MKQPSTEYNSEDAPQLTGLVRRQTYLSALRYDSAEDEDESKNFRSEVRSISENRVILSKRCVRTGAETLTIRIRQF